MIALVPHDRVDTPGVVGSWSVKDLIGHVATWDQEALQALRRYLVDRDAKALVTWPGDIDGFNAREAARKRATDLAVLRRELAECHRQIVELVSGLAGEELEIREVKARIRIDTYEHYADHTAQVLRWLEAPGSPPAEQ